MPDPAAVNSMFSRIARRYDTANSLLSWGIDSYWRKRLVRSVARETPQDVLDLATGSGDVAFALSQNLTSEVRITGMDFCQPMLDQAQAKKEKNRSAGFQNVFFRQGDVLQLPLADQSFDAITIAFGLRNLSDRDRGLREMRRVLRPARTLFVLEFSQPHRWVRPLYYLYLRKILPRMAGLITGDRAAYEYLNHTISEFPDRGSLTKEMLEAGFSSVDATPLTCGVVALHRAVR